MANDFALLLSALRLVIVLLGFTFLVVASRATRRHRSRGLLVLSVAVALLTLGMLWEAFSVQFLGWTETAAHIVEAFIMAVSLMVLVYSLIVPERGSGPAGTVELGRDEAE